MDRAFNKEKGQSKCQFSLPKTIDKSSINLQLCALTKQEKQMTFRAKNTPRLQLFINSKQ